MLPEQKILLEISKRNPKNPYKYVTDLIKNYQINKSNKNIIHCNKCKDCISKTLIYGDPNSEILVIGDYAKSLENFPFNKYEWDLMQCIFSNLNINTNKLLYMNIVNGILKSNKIPTKDEICNCKEYSYWTIKAIEPKLILLLGSISYNAFLTNEETNEIIYYNKPISKRQQISRNRGKWIDIFGIPAMPTYSPYYFYYLEKNNYNSDKIIDLKNDFYLDIKKAIEWYRKTYKEKIINGKTFSN